MWLELDLDVDNNQRDELIRDKGCNALAELLCKYDAVIADVHHNTQLYITYNNKLECLIR